MPKKPSKPHDEFFKATFSRIEIVVDYLQKMLPTELVDLLLIKELKRVNGSYISPALKEYFSDLIYECPVKHPNVEVSLALLFEHKSHPEQYPHLQLLRYMLDAWEEQLRQGKTLTLIIPIVIYHGEANWTKRNLSSYFGDGLPEHLLAFLPQFDYQFTHVTAMSDAEILALGKSLLVNTFLMMKHIWHPEFVLQNPHLIFIHLEEPNNMRDFVVALLAYFLKNSELAGEKIKNFIEILPRTLNQTAMSTYEMILKEGREQGLKINEDLLIKAQQRAEEERLRAEEERLRAEEERLRAAEALLREEEEHQRLDKVILHLFYELQLPITEIVKMTERDEAEIEALIERKNKED